MSNLYAFLHTLFYSIIVNAANDDTAEQTLDENPDAAHAFEPEVQVNEETYQPDFSVSPFFNNSFLASFYIYIQVLFT